MEQTTPAMFYSLLARDTAQLLADLRHDLSHTSLANARVLDVGGGPGYFADAFASHDAHYIALEPDVGEMAAAGITIPNAVRGDGMALPFADNSMDIVYSSNVAEHVPHPWRMADEMLRVCKPGGLMVLSYTVWLGPFGGHETGFWAHYLGGTYALRRYQQRHHRLPKNIFGTSLFAVSAKAGLKWGNQQRDEHAVTFFPRYHPWWAWWIIHIPLLREFFTSNLVIVVQKKDR
ncbi:class I SAM-dependent methyltransferase [Corynebacterium sp. HS2168-gen11]|uniref:class I SAM-dependent methyltransferase n=1 Tax=Corynebacterium sp. HS2168-gen11 TaxID=2974027 RepID=UPI00216B5585|nr:class I SAM-dependent methyltransferase [Corynebacterium sp. HS2168-gen11]MCS4535987.1 class I SAM-dependent methyltransferase [Corynebacterium sp. HS2168-gen11]